MGLAVFAPGFPYPTGMPRFFATCARGLERLLAVELAGTGATDIEPGRGGVGFAGNAETVYRANLWLRTAVRVLQPLGEDDVFSPEDLYDFVRSFNWGRIMSPDQTLAVDCNVRDSGITHSQYAARKVKDAICDQFRDRCGSRPSVDTERPMVALNLHIGRDHAVLSLDASWDSLHKRGYRPIQTRAPLNEALAAGLLLNLGYDGSAPLVDWMCGSGTFLVEGTWIAQNRPPGLTRKWFSFLGWKDFEPGIWAAVKDEARRGVKTTIPFPPRGSDVRQDAVDFAHANTRAAGIGNVVEVLKQDLRDARPKPDEPPGLLICNPPYGERLGEEEELVPLYREMGEAFAAHWPGWKLAVFTANDRLAKLVKWKALRTTHFYNGGIPCTLWEFKNDG